MSTISQIAKAIKTATTEGPTMSKSLDQMTAPKPAPVASQADADAMLNAPAQADSLARTPERNFSLKAIESPEDINGLLDATAKTGDGFKDQRRGKRSNAKTDAAADALIKSGKIDEDVLGKLPKGSTWNAEQLTAARKLVVNSAEDMRSLADDITNGQATKEDMLTFRQMVAKHQALQMHMQGLASEAGRALQSFQITAKSGGLSVAQMDALISDSGGTDAVEYMARLVSESDGVNGLNKAVAKTWEAKTSDVILEVWINGLLSGPTTHVANMTGNVLADAISKTERGVAAGIGSVRTGINRATGRGTQDRVYFGETGIQLASWLGSYMDGFRMMAKSIRTGESVDILQKVEQSDRRAFRAKTFGANEGSYLGKGLDMFGEYYVRMPGRFLQAEDDLFKTVAYRGEIQALAYRRALNEGAEDVPGRISELLNDPPDDLMTAAMDKARQQTFTDELGKTGQAIQDAAASNPLAKMMLPFIRTPMNIVNYAAERSPIAPLSRTWREDLAAGGARRDMAMARLSMGSAVSAAVFMGVGNGTITGAGPDDPGMREALKATGWRPNSVLIGDKYVSYNRLDPVGMIIGIQADAADMMRYAPGDKEIDDLVTSMVLGTASNLTSKQYLRGVSELFELLNGDRTASNYLGRQVSSFVPSWLNTVARNTDEPVLRDSRVTNGETLASIVQNIKKRIPGYSADLPPRLNAWGENIVASGAIGPDFMSPVYSSKAENDVIAAAMVENGVGIRQPRAAMKIAGQDFDLNAEIPHPKGYGWGLYEYRKSVGAMRQKLLDKTVNAKGFERLPAGEDSPQAEMLKSILNNATSIARAKFRAKMLKNDEISTALRVALETEARQTEFHKMPIPKHIDRSQPKGPQL